MAEEEITRSKTTRTTKKSTAKKSTAKKSPAKKSPAKKSTASKKTASKKSTGKKTASKKTTSKTASKKKSTPAKRTSSSVSITTDLKKFADEAYETTELLHGVTLIISSEGSEVIRSALIAFLASKVPLVGEQLGAQAHSSIIRKLNDDYKKFKAEERKAVRGVLNWLQGNHPIDEETTSELVRMINQPSASSLPPATSLPPSGGSPSLNTIAQGFVLPPQP